MAAKDTKTFQLSAEQWRALSRVAAAHPRAEDILLAGTRRALESRGLVATAEGGPFGRVAHVLTELGQRVYARLSAGCFCRICDKPLTFCRRVNVAAGVFECIGRCA